MNNNFMKPLGLVITTNYNTLKYVIESKNDNTNIPQTYILSNTSRYGYMYFRSLSIKILKSGQKILKVSKEVTFKTEDDDFLNDFHIISTFDLTMIVIPNNVVQLANCYNMSDLKNYNSYCKFISLDYKYGKYSSEEHYNLTTPTHYIYYIRPYFYQRKKMYTSYRNNIYAK